MAPDTKQEANLGLASTRELITELQVRLLDVPVDPGDVGGSGFGEMCRRAQFALSQATLDHRTVDGS